MSLRPRVNSETIVRFFSSTFFFFFWLEVAEANSCSIVWSSVMIELRLKEGKNGRSKSLPRIRRADSDDNDHDDDNDDGDNDNDDNNESRKSCASHKFNKIIKKPWRWLFGRGRSSVKVSQAWLVKCFIRVVAWRSKPASVMSCSLFYGHQELQQITIFIKKKLKEISHSRAAWPKGL